MNQQTSNALEQCNSCNNSAGSEPARNDALKPVTYDEGNGIKDKIVMSGPLSEIFTQALNQVFQKKPLELTNNPPEADVPVQNKPTEAASESYAQDHFMEKVVTELGNAAELDVVLADFDVQSVKQHVEDVKNNRLPAEAPEVTSVLVTDVKDILKPETYEPLVSGSFRGIALVVGDMGGTGPVEPPEESAMILFEDHAENQHCVERLFEGTAVKVCFGVQAFVQELKRRRADKAGK